MTDITEAENEQPDPPQIPQRRPWHAPSFVRLDTAATDVMCNAANDANPGSLS
jgi:hypothetical protein